MTGAALLESSAVRVLAELKRLDCRVAFDAEGRLHVAPKSRIPVPLLSELTKVAGDLKQLVRICDDGTQQRIAVFRRQLADTPAPQVPAFLFQPGVPYVKGHCFSCGAKLAEDRFGRCVRCSLAWRLAAGVDLPAELAAAVDEARVA